jgi:hypothetical protein
MAMRVLGLQLRNSVMHWADEENSFTLTVHCRSDFGRATSYRASRNASTGRTAKIGSPSESSCSVTLPAGQFAHDVGGYLVQRGVGLAGTVMPHGLGELALLGLDESERRVERSSRSSTPRSQRA